MKESQMKDLKKVDFSVIESQRTFPKGSRAVMNIMLTNGSMEIIHEGKEPTQEAMNALLFRYSTALNRAEEQIRNLISLIKGSRECSIEEYEERYEPNGDEASVYLLEETKYEINRAILDGDEGYKGFLLNKYHLINERLNSTEETAGGAVVG